MLWIYRLHNRKIINPQGRIVAQPVNSQTDEVWVIWTNYLLHFLWIFYTKCLCQSRWKTFLGTTTTMQMFQVIFSSIPPPTKMYRNKHIVILKDTTPSKSCPHQCSSWLILELYLPVAWLSPIREEYVANTTPFLNLPLTLEEILASYLN